MIKNNLNLNLPQKSLFGFKILNSIHSSLFAYIFIVLILFSKNFIGTNIVQLISGNLYIIISNMGFWILVINSYLKRKELNKNIYFAINMPLLGFLPFSFFLIIKYLLYTFNILEFFLKS
tara:strand:+ start:73 stop:432 length:360 start_codon:yes stop_codon:yes gene_type:complete